MTRVSKEQLLAAFDALNRIAMGRAAGHGKGNTMACDHCGSTPASGQHGGPFWERLPWQQPEPPKCPVAHALYLLSPLVPKFEDREKWLAE